MTCQLIAVCFDANDPLRLASFWAGVLGWAIAEDPDDVIALLPSDDTGFGIRFGFLGAVACDGSAEVGYFWSAALGWPLVWDQNQETAIRSPHGGPKITWGGPPMRPKTGKYRPHFDLAPPTDGDLNAEVARLVSLGAETIDSGQGEVSWVVLADPDGHEFGVRTPR